MLSRVLVAAALVVGSLVIAAPSASASCDPEKPSTCEPVTPHCHVTPRIDYRTPSAGASIYCHGEGIKPIYLQTPQ
jgi:hypothetical protein